MSLCLFSSITVKIVLLALLSLFSCALADDNSNGPHKLGWVFYPHIEDNQVGALQKCLDNSDKDFKDWTQDGVQCGGRLWYSISERWDSQSEAWNQCKPTIQDALNQRYGEGGCKTIGGKQLNRAASVGYRM